MGIQINVIKYINDINSSLTYVLAETDKDGKLKKSYTRGEELISSEVGVSSGNPQGSFSQINTGIDDIHYFLYDGHGSVCLLTDKEGNITDRYSYDGYGNLLEKEGETENDFLYTGEQYNYITELYYLRARYMDPSTGTFISMDSYAGTLYDPVSLHKYLYANANPVMNTDPSGYFSLSECIVTVGQKISMVNQKIHEIKTLQKMMNTANALCTAYDMLTMMKEVWLGERSIVDVALVLLRGIAIGYLINCACGTQLGVVLKPVLGALGVKSNVDELVEAINNRDVVEIIVRSVQLVCAIFGLTAQCFTGDTLISTENGLVPIEDIKVGDLVWTENIETGEQELKEVTKVYVNKTDKILHLTIEKEGDIETIDTTEGHPFYVEGKGWVRAGVLQKGDVLTSETGNAVVVSKQTENLSVPVIIYNLEVADNHTYYVSNKKVLVHNSGESGCSIKTSTDAESGTDSDVPLLETSKYVSGKTDDHHIIPKFRGGSQSYADFIAIRGIDVDQYTITVTSGKQGMHMNSIHGKGEWNPLWMEWIDEHPDATAVDIFQFAGKMMDDFGLSGYTIHPYKKGGN